jgi:glycosyltransferase involved in cell wall biosynthesis
MAEGLTKRVDPDLLRHFQIILSRVRQLEDRKRIYWLHDLPLDPEASHLADPKSRERFDKIVFCGQWQRQQYLDYLKIPFDSRLCVIENAVEPFPVVTKDTDVIRLIYISTPHRGLEILVPVFEKLCEKYSNIELDVFSSFQIYGWAERDKQYQALFDRCKTHPKIHYHGSQPHEIVREALMKAHILAYPSIWQECNCMSLIESMSAGLMCVHPNYGGLPDTAGGMTVMYDWDQDLNVHANKFYTVMQFAIEKVMEQQTQEYLRFVKQYADNRFNWNKIAFQWTALLKGML